MNKKIITLVAVTALTLALAGVYFLRPQPEPPMVEPPAIQAPLIDRLEEDVAQVTFTSGGESYTLIPIDGTWQLQAHPYFGLMQLQTRDKASIAWQLNTAVEMHESTEGLDLAQFGLAPPAFTITAHYHSGEQKNIYIGTHTADMQGYFIMVQGVEGLYVIPSFFAQRYTSPIVNLIPRTLQAFTPDAQYIAIMQTGQPTIEISTGVMPVLRMRQPHDRGLDHARLNTTLLTPLERFFLVDIVDINPQNLTPFGLDNPVLEFIYRDEVGETHLLFGDNFLVDGRSFIYVKHQNLPHVFKADYQAAQVLFNINPIAIVERLMHPVNILEVESIAITSPDPARNFNMVINHGPEFSHTIAPVVNNTPVDDGDFRVAYRLLVALAMEMEIESFTPTQTPDIVVTYHFATGEADEVRFFTYGENFYAISINGEDPWFVTHQRDVAVFFNFLAEL